MTLIYTKPAVRNAWADTPLNPGTDVVDPGNTYVQQGWQQGVKPPRPYFNWLLNYAASGIRYFMQRGVVEWDTAEQYSPGSVVQYAGIIYQALQSNIGNIPVSSPTTWAGLNVTTPAASDNSTKAATTAWVRGYALPLTTAISGLSGQVTNGQVPQSAVTQWQAALSIAFSQLTGSIANGQVPQSAVTQWQAALAIAWGQITGTKNADQLQGLVPGPSSSFAAGTLARYDPSGYLYAAYLNQASGNNENPSVSQLMVTNGTDNFLRKASAQAVANALQSLFTNLVASTSLQLGSANSDGSTISQIIFNTGADNVLRKGSIGSLMSAIGFVPLYNNSNPGSFKVTGTPFIVKYGSYFYGGSLSSVNVPFDSNLPTAQLVSWCGSSLGGFKPGSSPNGLSGLTLNFNGMGGTSQTIYWFALGY